jgi:hypothetical protein
VSRILAGMGFARQLKPLRYFILSLILKAIAPRALRILLLIETRSQVRTGAVCDEIACEQFRSLKSVFRLLRCF